MDPYPFHYSAPERAVDFRAGSKSNDGCDRPPGQNTLDFLASFGEPAKFLLGRAGRRAKTVRWPPTACLKQIYSVGVLSLVIVHGFRLLGMVLRVTGLPNSQRLFGL